VVLLFLLYLEVWLIILDSKLPLF